MMSDYQDEADLREKYSASLFARGTMFCPGCRVAMREPVEACLKCGYSGRSSVEKFPFAAPEFERFIDPDDLLSVDDCQKIDEVLNGLGEDFPQPRFCFCLVELAEETDPREFGFWLMNASPVRSPVEERLRPWSILLLIDDAHGRVSVTSGYAIEPFLNEESWNSLLTLESQAFASGDYGKAILRFLDGAAGVLSEGAERVQRGLSGKKGRKSGKGGGW